MGVLLLRLVILLNDCLHAPPLSDLDRIVFCLASVSTRATHY